MSVWQKDYQTFSQAHSKSSAFGSKQDCSLIIFKRSSHFTLKGIDFFCPTLPSFFLSMPVISPAVRVYLCQSYKQSLQVTVLISVLWLPMRFSWGLWEQLVCQCNSQTELGSLAWHESDLLPLCLMPIPTTQAPAIGTGLVPGYRLFCYGKAS